MLLQNVGLGPKFSVLRGKKKPFVVIKRLQETVISRALSVVLAIISELIYINVKRTETNPSLSKQSATLFAYSMMSQWGAFQSTVLVNCSPPVRADESICHKVQWW